VQIRIQKLAYKIYKGTGMGRKFVFINYYSFFFDLNKNFDKVENCGGNYVL